ncbi:MAG TPA: hypothetical protein VG711_01865 [Phycisphaerales bacterium]|nr:hypothetical protein [Phycisphaerales bacterium]
MESQAIHAFAAKAHVRAFTIVELLVVIGIVALLVALLAPALSSMKESSGETRCASNLRQIGIATINYVSLHGNCLPQQKVTIAPGTETVIGALFGGKKGQLPAYDINVVGADKRPLNKYLTGGSAFGPDSEVPVFECPLDRGQPPHPFLPQTDSMYDFIGTSYNLNDHTLNSESCTTLVPQFTGTRPGGKMPGVADPTKTWMIADIPVYNYQDDNQNGVADDDRLQRWHFKTARVNMCFVDGHIGVGIDLTKGLENTARTYTFLPSPNWNCGNPPVPQP